MLTKQDFAFIIILVLVLTFLLLDNLDVSANRYSSCIERHSAIGKLSYDEMREVCSEYLGE